jgi:hypothetical protein
MATVRVEVQDFGEFDGTVTIPLPYPLLPLLRFVGEQSGKAADGAPWSSLAQALVTLAVTGAQHYVAEWARVAVKRSAAQLFVREVQNANVRR